MPRPLPSHALSELTSRLSICDPRAHSHPHTLTLTLTHTRCTLHVQPHTRTRSHIHAYNSRRSLSRAFPWSLYALLHITNPISLRVADSVTSAFVSALFRKIDLIVPHNPVMQRAE